MLILLFWFSSSIAGYQARVTANEARMPNWFPLRNGNWAVTEGDTVVRVLPSRII